MPFSPEIGVIDPVAERLLLVLPLRFLRRPLGVLLNDFVRGRGGLWGMKVRSPRIQYGMTASASSTYTIRTRKNRIENAKMVVRLAKIANGMVKKKRKGTMMP